MARLGIWRAARDLCATFATCAVSGRASSVPCRLVPGAGSELADEIWKVPADSLRAPGRPGGGATTSAPGKLGATCAPGATWRAATSPLFLRVSLDSSWLAEQSRRLASSRRSPTTHALGAQAGEPAATSNEQRARGASRFRLSLCAVGRVLAPVVVASWHLASN